MAVNERSRQVDRTGFRRTLRRHAKTWLIVAGVAALVRVVYLVQYASSPFFNHLIMDARGYYEWSREIAAGNWLGDRVFYQEPLYPYVLALIGKLFGTRTVAIYIVQATLGVVNSVLVALLGARIARDRVAGLIGGLAFALYGPMLFYEAMVLKPVWGVFFLLVSVHLLFSAWERPRWWLWMLAGLSTALLGLTRGNALLVIPFILAWIVIAGWKSMSRRRLVAALGIFLAATALPLLVVMLRNAWVGGEFVLSSSHAGFNFYIGNNPEADGTYEAVAGVREDPRVEGSDARALASRRAGRSLNAAEASSFWFSKGLEFMKSHPGAWLRLQAVKFARFFNAWEVPDTFSPSFVAQHVSTLRLAFVSYGMLAPVALLGIVALHRRGPRAWLVELLVLTIVLSVILFYVFGRYRMPVVPLFAALAGGGVTSFVAWIRRGEYLRPAAAIVGVGLAVFLVNFVTIRTNTTAEEYRASDLANLGNLHADAGEIKKARECYNRALLLQPGLDRALLALAISYVKEGETKTASRLLADLLEKKPGNAQAHYVLAMILNEEGRPLDAIVSLERAVAASPGFFEARRDLGALYMQEGTKHPGQALDYYRKARHVLQAAAELNGDSWSVWYNLGEARYSTGDTEGAFDALRQALRTAQNGAQRARARQALARLAAKERP